MSPERHSIIMQGTSFPVVGTARGLLRGCLRSAHGVPAAPLERHGERQARQVALTFDDGPAEATGVVLDALRVRGARATFFVVGWRLRSFSSLVCRVAADGHELGNHTWNHRLSGGRLGDLAQLAATNAEIQRVSGSEPSLFRPPFGRYQPRLAHLVAAAGLSAVGWDVDSSDWRRPDPDALVEHVMAETRNGSIILLHDGPQMAPSRVATVLDRLLRRLADQGYELVTVSELLGGRRVADDLAPSSPVS